MISTSRLFRRAICMATSRQLTAAVAFSTGGAAVEPRMVALPPACGALFVVGRCLCACMCTGCRIDNVWDGCCAVLPSVAVSQRNTSPASPTKLASRGECNAVVATANALPVATGSRKQVPPAQNGMRRLPSRVARVAPLASREPTISPLCESHRRRVPGRPARICIPGRVRLCAAVHVLYTPRG